MRRVLCVLVLCSMAGAMPGTLETVRFELPGIDGKPVRSAELDARFVLLVYQGIP